MTPKLIFMQLIAYFICESKTISCFFYTKQAQYSGLEKDSKVNHKFMFEEFEVNEKIILRYRKEIFYIIMLEIIKITI